MRPLAGNTRTRRASSEVAKYVPRAGLIPSLDKGNGPTQATRRRM